MMSFLEEGEVDDPSQSTSTTASAATLLCQCPKREIEDARFVTLLLARVARSR
jgi:hypothetical protein